MIVLLNYLVPAVLVSLALVAYKTKRYAITTVGALIFVLFYNAYQPSYMPKGTVPSLKVTPTEYVDKSIVDRTRKVMTVEERDERMHKKSEAAESRREKLIDDMNKEKENG